MTTFSPDQRLRERYRLIAQIGAGGMSEVWRATDEVLGRAVAVKVLATPLVADPAARRLTWREARAVAQLNHPRVAQVHDYGELPLPDGGSAGYLVMELVTGRTLADRLGSGPLRWPEAAVLVGQVAEGLAAAHAVGLVHRDVKPGNVMLTDSGAKVLDFGIAAAAGNLDTDPGRLAGTPAYAAPERFDTTGAAQPASDVYSLGVLLYECLVGRPPLSVRNWSEAQAAHRGGMAAPRPPVPGLPEPLARLCQSCLSPDPATRPPASQVARELMALAAEAGSVTTGARGWGSAAVAGVGAGVPAHVGAQAGADPAGAPGGAGASAGAVGSADPRHDQSAGSTRYAVGAAALPAPATRVLHDGTLTAGSRRWPGWATPAAAVAGLAVAAVLLVVLLSGGGLWSGPQAAPVDLEPPATAPVESPNDRAGGDPLLGFDLALTDGLVGGVVSQDAHEDLREELADLRELLESRPVSSPEVGEQLTEIREEIAELVADGELDPATADQLRELLVSLSERPATG